MKPTKILPFEDYNVKKLHRLETDVMHTSLFCNEMANIFFGDKLYIPKRHFVKNISAQ